MLKWKGRPLAAACTCCIEPSATGISRRTFIAGASAGLAATSLTPLAFAQAKPHRIDVHCHIVPPTWFAAMEGRGLRGMLLGPLSNWSIQKMIDDMDQGGVATAVTSPTTPQVTPLDPATAARVARESNEFAKKMAADHKGRFGIFAMLPLPNIDDSLKEIAYAFDTLKVDGVGVMTSYRDKWLGDESFAPIWEELNRRKAVVYTHPTTANCCTNLIGLGDAVVEFGADTARAIASVLFSGTSMKYKDITWIWSHGGGALVGLAERFQTAQILGPQMGKFTREMVDGELKRFYYDTAQVSGAVTLEALSKLVSSNQIVFGTDFPYRTAADHAKNLTAFFKGDDLKNVDRENALRLMPRLKEA